MELTDIQRLTKLAHLHLDESQQDILLKKISGIIEHFQVLLEVDTQNIEPLFHYSEQMNLREDVEEAPIARNDLLKNAPDQLDGLFRLPKVVGAVE